MLKMTIVSMVGLALRAVVGMGAWVYVVNNVEHPAYRLVRQDGAIEIRDYPTLIQAEVTRTGDRKTAVTAGFRSLAAYIFARERAGDSIAMTAPVTQERPKIAMTAPVAQSPEQGADGNRWVVQFIMPSEYTLEALPRPASPDIRLRETEPKRRAAIRFSGVATDRLLAANEKQLRNWLARQGLQASAVSTYAYYNDPFTPGPLRRNEVIVDVLGETDGS